MLDLVAPQTATWAHPAGDGGGLQRVFSPSSEKLQELSLLLRVRSRGLLGSGLILGRRRRLVKVKSLTANPVRVAPRAAVVVAAKDGHGRRPLEQPIGSDDPAAIVGVDVGAGVGFGAGVGALGVGRILD